MLLLTELLKTILVRDSAIVHVFTVQRVRKLLSLVYSQYLPKKLQHFNASGHAHRLQQDLPVEAAKLTAFHIDCLAHQSPFGLNLG